LRFSSTVTIWNGLSHPGGAVDTSILFSLFLIAATAVASEPSGKPRGGEEIANPQIDMPAFLASAQEAAEHRRTHRVGEEEFLAMMEEPGTIVLDARSAQKFAELHIKGATNLDFPDITLESLARLIPNKDTRVLIYCNNNFANAQKPFPAKLASASLNLSTYVALYEYGYRNVYELGPNVKLEDSKLPFEGKK
jgi:hypothetical protein